MVTLNLEGSWFLCGMPGLFSAGQGDWIGREEEGI